MSKTSAIALTIGLALAFPLMGQELTGQQAPPPQEQVEAVEPDARPADAEYTNESIARLSHLTGSAFIQRASDIGYEECVVNTPVTEGDRLGTTDGRAEVRFGPGNYVRLDSETKVDFLGLPRKGEDAVRIRVWFGSVYFEVSRLAREKGVEIHTADTSFYVLDEGLYRVDVKENSETEVLVFRGLVEAAGEEGSTLIKAGQRLEASEGRFSRPTQFMAAATDGFDRWNDSRNVEVSKRLPKRYLDEDLGDFEAELAQNGEWVYLPPSGNVWVPRGVGDDWRPYSNGRWTWLPLSGWTWLPYEPWGWATFHYGRWHWGVGMGWYWIPSSFWGPGWVDWWWDDLYFGWAPLSYWGYPVVVLDGGFYGRWHGDYFPWNSHSLVVIRRDQLRAKNIAPVALRGDALKGLNRITLSSGGLPLRPVGGSGTLVQPIEGHKVLLRKGDGPVSLKGGTSSLSGASGQRVKSGSLGARKGTAKGETKSAKPSSKTTSGKVRKKNESSSFSLSRYGIDGPGYRASGASEGTKVLAKGIFGYPSSIRIGKSRYSSSGDNPWRESGIGRILRQFSGSNYTVRKGSSSTSSGSRGTTSSSTRSGSVSRGSSTSSHGSSSKGSSPSHGASSGKVHKH